MISEWLLLHFQNGKNKDNTKGGVGEGAQGGGVSFIGTAEEEDGGGREVGEGWKVTQVIADPAAGADGSGGRDIMKQAHNRREGPLQRVPEDSEERSTQETPEVWAGDDGSPQDLLVPDDHCTPHL